MEDLTIFIGERNFGMKCHFNEYSTDELINELCRLCTKKEEDIQYIDIRKMNVIWFILMERRGR
jgi:hypothetical protein